MLYKGALPLTIAALALVASVGFAAASTETAPETTPEATPAAAATPSLTKDKCVKAIEEDNKLNEPKLTEAFLKQCAELTTAAMPLRPAALTEAERAEVQVERTATAPKPAEPDLSMSFDLPRELQQRIAMDDEIREIRQENQNRVMEHRRALQARLDDPNQREAAQAELRSLRNTLGGWAGESMAIGVMNAEADINFEGTNVRYQAEANAAETYETLSRRPSEELTAEDQINLASTASMAGAYAGRSARESGRVDEQTQAMIDKDPVFEQAFNEANREPPLNEGLGGFHGQFREAEPRRVAGASQIGLCNSPIGNVPSMPCGVVTSPVGVRNIAWSPYHFGWDIRANQGDAIFARAIGRVADVRYEGPGRVSVHVDHGNGFVTVHRHVAERSALAVGAAVNGSTQIGAVATAGTGPHEHIEIWLNGRVLNVNNFNQLAYADHCTVDCPSQGSTPNVTVVAETRAISDPVTDGVRGLSNGTSVAVAFTGGFRGGAHQLASAGQVGGGRPNTLTYDIGTRDIGDGGWADTAPRFGPNVGAFNGSPQPNNGQPLQPNQNIQQALSGLGKNSPNAITLASLDERRDGKATQKLTAEACRQQLKETRFAMDVLLKNPECAGVR